VPVNSFLLRSKIKDYKVIFHDNAGFLAPLFSQPNMACLVDANVWRIYKNTLLWKLTRDNLIIVPVGEEKKNLLTVQYIYRQLLKRQAKKNLHLIVIGGGILQDLCGFVASTLYRGIGWTFVPTTMLAQTDSCIGAKTSLNFGKYKNVVGTFFPPLEVHIYSGWLKTSKKTDYLSGLGESAKLHLMGGAGATRKFQAALPALLNRNLKAVKPIIYNSLLIKKGYIEKDEFDRGRRNLLNYGHCFGHALETATNYRIPHGLAVVLGMILANRVAVTREPLKEATAGRISRDILMPISHKQIKQNKIKAKQVIKAMMQDKKRVGDGLPLVMLIDNNRLIKIDDLSEKEAMAAIGWLNKEALK